MSFSLMVNLAVLAVLAVVQAVATTSASSKISGVSNRFSAFSDFVLKSQASIIKTLEGEDGVAKFAKDPWEKRNPANNDLMGYGITAVMEKGDLLEKAAVSTTIVKGLLSPERAAAISSRTKNNDNKIKVGSQYFAAAISLVLHSKSPMVPTFRSDVRFFELGGVATDAAGAAGIAGGGTGDDDQEDRFGWFGGGADLTPYYLFDEDAKEFHRSYAGLCAASEGGNALYQRMKGWCDRYFYLPARAEHRGVGGIFYDDLSSLKVTAAGDESSSAAAVATDKLTRALELDNAMKFTESVCDHFMPSYLPIVRRRRALPYSEEQRHWQLLRRGRYIEFNMLYDRGVKFGLVPGGRTEAVMVSCPPLVAWQYNHTPVPGSEEARLMDILKQPKEWI